MKKVLLTGVLSTALLISSISATNSGFVAQAKTNPVPASNNNANETRQIQNQNSPQININNRVAETPVAENRFANSGTATEINNVAEANEAKTNPNSVVGRNRATDNTTVADQTTSEARDLQSNNASTQNNSVVQNNTTTNRGEQKVLPLTGPLAQGNAQRTDRGAPHTGPARSIDRRLADVNQNNERTNTRRNSPQHQVGHFDEIKKNITNVRDMVRNDNISDGNGKVLLNGAADNMGMPVRENNTITNSGTQYLRNNNSAQHLGNTTTQNMAPATTANNATQNLQSENLNTGRIRRAANLTNVNNSEMTSQLNNNNVSTMDANQNNLGYQSQNNSVQNNRVLNNNVQTNSLQNENIVTNEQQNNVIATEKFDNNQNNISGLVSEKLDRDMLPNQTARSNRVTRNNYLNNRNKTVGDNVNNAADNDVNNGTNNRVNTTTNNDTNRRNNNVNNSADNSVTNNNVRNNNNTATRNTAKNNDVNNGTNNRVNTTTNNINSRNNNVNNANNRGVNNNTIGRTTTNYDANNVSATDNKGVNKNRLSQANVQTDQTVNGAQNDNTMRFVDNNGNVYDENSNLVDTRNHESRNKINVANKNNSVKNGSVANNANDVRVVDEAKESGLINRANEQVNRGEYRRHKIIVNGVGEINKAPNIATVQIGIESVNKDILEAEKENQTRVSRVVEMLENHGIDKNDIKTKHYNVYQKYNYREGEEFVGHQVSNYIEFKTKNIDQVSSLVSQLMNVGVTQFNGIEFTLSQDQSSYEEALRMAIENARAKAIAMVGSDVTLNITKIIEAPTNHYGMESAKRFMTMDVASSSILKNDVQVCAKVLVEFEY